MSAPPFNISPGNLFRMAVALDPSYLVKSSPAERQHGLKSSQPSREDNLQKQWGAHEQVRKGRSKETDVRNREERL